MQSDCSNNSLLLLLNTERLQQIADYDLFIKLFLEAPFCTVPHDIFDHYN